MKELIPKKNPSNALNATRSLVLSVILQLMKEYTLESLKDMNVDIHLVAGKLDSWKLYSMKLHTIYRVSKKNIKELNMKDMYRAFKENISTKFVFLSPIIPPNYGG